jgi:hypothetical protein
LDIDQFITRWKSSGGSERANYQLFLSELTRVLDLPVPQPATGDLRKDEYRFDHPVQYGPLDLNQRGFIDLYKRGHFVLETKQGTDADQGSLPLFPSDPAPTAAAKGHGVRGSRRWAIAMQAARGQAGNYANGVARTDGWPPFVLVVDVGYMIEVFADFSANGHGYGHFPDAASYRIDMDDLRDPAIRERLRLIWTNPQALNPASISARVTRQVSASLAELGKSLEGRGHDSEAVARYLMRCLFTMFAEDVELIPKDGFKQLLHRLRGHPQDAADALSGLWAAMDKGDFAAALTTRVKRFNGGLFRETTAFPLQPEELHLLIRAADADWKSVEPAIFGTLLERALDTRQRHKLGAHYTPRAYVERLVVPTVIEPLRQDWDAARAAALHQVKGGDAEAARATLRAFRDRLCQIRVLDPACGSGNFLYVTMELMKRLEAEVNELLTDLGETQSAFLLQGHTIDPHQFLGIEVNPWAAAVAELVLWIGYLQWHFRTHGNASPAEPVLRDFRNIENRDAVLAWDARERRLDATGAPVTRWDGIGTIAHPATGDPVPDPDARVQVWTYANPRPATWPEVDYIVGNPPFIGTSRMREALGDGYTEALRAAYPDVPDSADFVMFWWEKAALATRAGHTRRFGLITTNSLRQTFNRKVLEPHLSDQKSPLSLAFAIPDHPWVDEGGDAAVRIAMTVGTPGTVPGRLLTVTDEAKGETESEGRPVTLIAEKGMIFANLRIGADVAGAKALRANGELAHMGVKLHGMGFIVTRREALALGWGVTPGLDRHIRPFLNGRDLAQTSRSLMAIDFFGLTRDEAAKKFPAAFQRVLDTVKPERDQNNRATYRTNWWVFGEPRGELRPALAGLSRFIATPRTARHRIFQFVDADTIGESKLVVIAVEDAALLAILSSRPHERFSLAAGGWLGVGNDPTYNHSGCFNPFPFPDLTAAQKASLRSLGEQLDAHRKAQQAAHPGLTLTAMYNVLEKLRAKTPLDHKDREIYDKGLVSILREMHDDIDAQVAAAYGWPVDLAEDDLLQRLVDLNRTRASEEARGLVRWLRPEYQNPSGRADGVQGEQIDMGIGPAEAPGKLPWPRDLPGQVAAVQAALSRQGTATPAEIARQFKNVRSATVENLLETLTAISYARKLDGGRYVS